MGKNSVDFKNEQEGFIALISAIVISLVLLGLVFLLSSGGYFARADAADGEYKRVSLGLAESCVNEALLQIGQNAGYAGGVNVPIGSNNCTIQAVTYYNPSTGTGCGNPTSGYNPSHQKIACINTAASYQGAFSKMSIEATIWDPSQTAAIGAPNITITSWQEDP